MRFLPWSCLTLGVASVVVVACGTGTSAPGGAIPPAGGDGGTVPLLDGGIGGIGLDGGVAPPGSYNLSFGPVDVAPGEEQTKCVVKRLANPEKLRVGAIHNVLSKGSHHLIVYRVSDTAEQTTPFDCKPFTDTLDATKGSTLMITQKADDALVLPDGVAYTLEPKQMVRLEMHYINTGTTKLAVAATSTFIPIDEAKFRDEADFLFIGTPDIDLKAKSSLTVGPMFIKLPAEYGNVNFFALTGHQHHFGTNVKVSTAANKSDPGTSVYDVPGWLWSEPATVQASPPFKLPAGGGFKFTCSWTNTSNQDVGFGESANQEMCFFWAYYYPSQGGAKVCVHTDKLPGGVDACCPGASPVCNYIKGL